MKPIVDHRGLIDALGGNAAVARELPDCNPGRISQWKILNRIPAEYWEGIIELAGKQNMKEISADWLLQKMRPRKMPAPEEGQAA